MRFGPWAIGMILAYNMIGLRGKRVHMSPLTVGFGWIATIVTLLAVVFLYCPIQDAFNASSPLAYGLYDGLTRIFWPLAMSFLVFACVHGYGGQVNWFLSLTCWQPFARLSYAIYIVHPPLVVLEGATIRSTFYISDYEIVG